MDIFDYNPLDQFPNIWGQNPPCVGQPQLSDEDKKRVCLIEDIDKIQYSLTGEHLTVRQFEAYMIAEMDNLERYVYDQSAVLNRHHYDKRIQGEDF